LIQVNGRQSVIVWPGLIMIGALWLIIFPVSMVLLALAFRRTQAAPEFGRAPAGKIHAWFLGGLFRLS
jgi:hypothetical protein